MSEHAEHDGRDAGFALDHVAIGVPKLAEAAAWLAGVLGGRPFEGGPGVGFRWGQWSFAGAGRIELIEPVGPPDGFLHRFLARHGAGVHHVTFKVPDLARASQRARDFGYAVVGYDDSFPGWKEAFLHPKQAQGIVVQLAESDPDEAGDALAAWEFPPAPPSPPDPVRLVSLQLAARSLDAARRQWGELLGGRCEAVEGGLVFRWTDSPLAVAVRADAAGPEGPRAIEIATDRAVDRDGLETVLGTRFVGGAR